MFFDGREVTPIARALILASCAFGNKQFRSAAIREGVVEDGERFSRSHLNNRQLAAALESVLSDLRHGGRNGDILQVRTIPEGILANAYDAP